MNFLFKCVSFPLREALRQNKTESQEKSFSSLTEENLSKHAHHLQSEGTKYSSTFTLPKIIHDLKDINYGDDFDIFNGIQTNDNLTCQEAAEFSRVILVENSLINCRFMRRILAHYEFDADIALDFEEAFQYLKCDLFISYDLIVISADSCDPASVRELKSEVDIKIVVLGSNQEQLALFREVGVDALLLAPLSPPNFVGTLCSLFNKTNIMI